MTRYSTRYEEHLRKKKTMEGRSLVFLLILSAAVQLTVRKKGTKTKLNYKRKRLENATGVLRIFVTNEPF